MTETKEPKVTECFAEVVATQDNPEWLDVQGVQVTGYRPAILLWREDYDAMRRELEELREESAKWKPFEHGHYKQEGKMVYYSLSTDRHTEAHDDKEAK